MRPHPDAATPQRETNVFDEARRLLAAGLPPVALCAPTVGGGCTAPWHTDCGSRAGKRPLGVGYARFANLAHADDAASQVDAYARRLGTINVAVVVPHGMAVVEADSPEAEAEVIALCGGVPTTLTRERRPGRGRAWFFATSAPIANAAHRGASGAIDARGPGGILVVPPSIHASGHALAWEAGREPWSVDVAPLPTALATLLRPIATAPATPRPPRMASQPTPITLPPIVSRLLSCDLELSRLWRGEGKRTGDTSSSGYDYAIAARLLRLGARVDDIERALLARPGAHRRDEAYARGTVSRAAVRR